MNSNIPCSQQPSSSSESLNSKLSRTSIGSMSPKSEGQMASASTPSSITKSPAGEALLDSKPSLEDQLAECRISNSLVDATPKSQSAASSSQPSRPSSIQAASSTPSQPEPLPSAPTPASRSSISRSGRPRLNPYDRNYGVCITVKGLLKKYVDAVATVLKNHNSSIASLPSPNLQLVSDSVQLLNARVVTCCLFALQPPAKAATADSITDAIKPPLDELYLKIVPTLVAALINEDGGTKQGKESQSSDPLFIPGIIKKDIFIHGQNVISALIQTIDFLPCLCQAFGHLFDERTSLPTEPFKKRSQNSARDEVLTLSGIVAQEAEVLTEYVKKGDVFDKYISRLRSYIELVEDAIRELNGAGTEDEDDFDDLSSREDESSDQEGSASGGTGQSKSDDSSGSAYSEDKAHDEKSALSTSLESKTTGPAVQGLGATPASEDQATDQIEGGPVAAESPSPESLECKLADHVDITDILYVILEFAQTIMKVLLAVGPRVMTSFVRGQNENTHVLDSMYTHFAALQEEVDEVAGSFYENDAAGITEHMHTAGQLLVELEIFCRQLYPLVPRKLEEVMNESKQALSRSLGQWEIWVAESNALSS